MKAKIIIPINNIRFAYTLVHGYVWLWSDHPTNWWEEKVVKAYVDAVANNKRPLAESKLAEMKRAIAESEELRKRIRPAGGDHLQPTSCQLWETM